jgi:hypothetical protein
VSYTPTITREERRAYWNTYKIEDNGSVKLFQVRQQDNKWFSRIVTRSKGRRVAPPMAREIDAIQGEAYFTRANS